MSRSSWLHANNSASSSSTTNNNKKLKGVRRRKWGKYVSEIRVPGTQERLWLGTYATPEAAAVAHDVAVYCLKKPSSLEKLNFPDTLSSYHHCLQQREDLSPRSVQKVASDVAMDVDARNINGRSTTLATTTNTVAVTETSSGSYCSEVLLETGVAQKTPQFLEPYNAANGSYRTVLSPLLWHSHPPSASQMHMVSLPNNHPVSQQPPPQELPDDYKSHPPTQWC
ncbi:hypothetical protein Ahy_A05g024764 [Arachis hypogaea]|uniref:AP2/ERF domain-containing protein n=1 Tax=Arachis hypogaea TaxID=3818 RepID=A0A445D6Y0_ARAHY|nr:hypothetical protein Ahy_A05g024764 [Arachis hypogaea]